MAEDEALITAKVTRTASEISSFSLIRIRSWGSLWLVSGAARWVQLSGKKMLTSTYDEVILLLMTSPGFPGIPRLS